MARHDLADLAHAASELLGVPVGEHRSLGGGLSRIVRLCLADGRRVVVKDGPDPIAEGNMLDAIAGTGCPAPAVLAGNAHVLVMEDLENGANREATSLGRAIALLHARTGDAYGWSCDYAFSTVTIAKPRSSDWPAFFAQNRLVPGLENLSGATAKRLEHLVATIHDRLPARPAAALLHGDLWGGNIVADRTGVFGLVDPACYHGHAEVDLAMMALFGGAPSAAFHADYGELEPGWQTRRAIYQLWPAIVHLKLFGSGYRSMVESRLDAAGV